MYWFMPLFYSGEVDSDYVAYYIDILDLFRFPDFRKSVKYE